MCAEQHLLSSFWFFDFGNSPTEYFAAFVLPLTSASFWQPSLLLLMFIFLISGKFVVLSINSSFLIFEMILVCVLPSKSVGLFLSTYLSARYLSSSISSKIWDLAFSLANYKWQHAFLLWMIFSFSSSALSLIDVFPRELLDDFVFWRTWRFLGASPWWFLWWTSTGSWFIVSFNFFDPIVYSVFLSKHNIMDCFIFFIDHFLWQQTNILFVQGYQIFELVMKLISLFLNSRYITWWVHQTIYQLTFSCHPCM